MDLIMWRRADAEQGAAHRDASGEDGRVAVRAVNSRIFFEAEFASSS
jgi:hypothetical protein